MPSGLGDAERPCCPRNAFALGQHSIALCEFCDHLAVTGRRMRTAPDGSTLSRSGAKLERTTARITFVVVPFPRH